MPRAKNDAGANKRANSGKVFGDIADKVMSRIGGPARVADVIEEGLQSSVPFLRNRAMAQVMDLAKNGIVAEADAADLSDDEVDEELKAYMGRVLVDMREEEYDAFLNSVELRRTERRKAAARLKRAKEKEAVPTQAEEFVMAPV